MNYRCAKKIKCYKENVNAFEVVNVARDENQKGGYGDDAEWCDFTVKELPEISEEVWGWMETNEYLGTLNLVENSTVRVKTIGELNNE